MKDIHYLIADIVNRSYNQSDFLLKLCDNDLVLYINLEAKLKCNFPSFVPANRETIDYILSTDYKVNDTDAIIDKKLIPEFTEIFLRK